VLSGGRKCFLVVGEGVKVVGVRRRGDILGVAVWCVFPQGENELGGVGRVVGFRVCAGDCMFHGAVHAFVVVLWISDVRAVPRVRRVVATAG
jgi:hypothetical protein